ncbi:MAG: helix-turn-helix domain-containing protein [Archaeoglobaceae archaeon]
MRKEVVREILDQIKFLFNELERELSETRPEREAYTISEFAQRVGLHNQTIWRHIKAGRLKATRLGSKYLIPASELTKFLKA